MPPPAAPPPSPPQRDWARMRFREGKVWVLLGADGAPELAGGRARYVYKLGDGRLYSAALDQLTPLPDQPPAQAPLPAATGPKTPKPRATAAAKSAKTAADRAASSTADGREPIMAYTDGACSGNPGPSGSGVVMRWRGRSRELARYLGETTNNVAELTAIRLALETIRKPDWPILLHTDSTYCIGVLSKGWKATKNQELIAAIQSLMRQFPRLTLVKVAGHAGVPDNERADELARLAVERRADWDAES